MLSLSVDEIAKVPAVERRRSCPFRPWERALLYAETVTTLPAEGVVVMTSQTHCDASRRRRTFFLTYCDGPFSSVIGQFPSRRAAVAEARGYGFCRCRFRDLTRRPR